MTANPHLVQKLNISPENVAFINELHDMLDELLTVYNLNINIHEAITLSHDMEFLLQRLWGFHEDPLYHKFSGMLKQKWMNLMWIGRVFKCLDTGVTYTLSEEEVYEGSYIRVGNGAIDLGRAGCYHRVIGNVVEEDHAIPSEDS